MAKKKFDQKIYQGRKRVMVKVPGTSGVQRAWVWDKDRGQYAPPPIGKTFEAFRYDPTLSGGKKRVHKGFETLEEARAWQNRLEVCDKAIVGASGDSNTDTSPALAEVIENYRKLRYPMRALGTRVHYDQLIELHFGYLMSRRINAITARVIDDWLVHLKAPLATRQSSQRKSFDKELTLLGIILRHYDEYYEDSGFRFPIKKRHRTDSVVRRDVGERDRDLPYADFLKVREVARKDPQGLVLDALLTMQYRQALRVSEACALFWEDVRLDLRAPENSVIRVARHIEWSRKKGVESVISLGFKNSRTTGAVKELPMFPEVYFALRELYYVGARGLIFKNRQGTFFSYRQVQDLYERAFKKAGVEFTGTHSLRHGGCRAIYNEAGGDMALAGQILGNEDSNTVRVYARRDRGALKRHVNTHWQNWEADCTNLYEQGI